MAEHDTNEGPGLVRPSPTTTHSVPPTSPGGEASPASRVRLLLLCLLPSCLFLLSASVYAWAMAFTTFNERTVLFPVVVGLPAIASGLAYHWLRWGSTDGWDDIGLNGAFLWRRGHKALGAVATAITV